MYQANWVLDKFILPVQLKFCKKSDESTHRFTTHEQTYQKSETVARKMAFILKKLEKFYIVIRLINSLP